MKKNLPKHIAIIMDGNGRWAKERGLPRLEGHRQGVEVVDAIVTHCKNLKIRYLTLYAFSDENWNRPTEEVETLMQLLELYLKAKQEKMVREGVALQTIGDTSKLPESVQQTLAETKEITKKGANTQLILALSYGARLEIVRSINRLFQNRKANGNIHSEIGEEEFASFLDTKDYPDPDLLIRTSGEYRISNFLLWQLAYTELYFTKTMWPDFTPKELDKALEEFSKRERRFGKISEQL